MCCAVVGDDYPAQWKNVWNSVDNWGLYTRQCTSFVAWRLSSKNGFNIPRAYGNADQWAGRASREGYTVDGNPAIGAVGCQGCHVVWVAEVSGGTVTVEEYNTPYDSGTYNKRKLPIGTFTYIHFQDLRGPISPSSNLGRTIYTIADVQLVFGAWQARINTLAPADFDWKDNGIPLSVLTLVDDSGRPLANQEQAHAGSRCVFKKTLTMKGAPTNGSGGYIWIQVQGDGLIFWVSAYNLDHLYDGTPE